MRFGRIHSHRHSSRQTLLILGEDGSNWPAFNRYWAEKNRLIGDDDTAPEQGQDRQECHDELLTMRTGFA
jgi:hypothetical protein